MARALPIYQVDAFTDAAFAGNPAAVCLLDRPADAGWMQQVAAEMNLAETAFVEPRRAISLGGVGAGLRPSAAAAGLCPHGEVFQGGTRQGAGTPYSRE